MLELEVIDSNDCKMQMVTTLQSTSQGKKMYGALCERQIALRELVSAAISTHQASLWLVTCRKMIGFINPMD